MTIPRPNIRGGFSDRNNIKSINTIIQKEEFDQRTRNVIINFFDSILKICSDYAATEDIYKYIYKVIFCLTNDEMPSSYRDRRNEIIRGIKEEWSYDEILSFLEAITNWCKDNLNSKGIHKILNDIFQEECIGYRFIDGKITDIIDKQEINAIEEALKNKYTTCKNHINQAMNLLYNREQPDYANSVKESISAIESMCNIILETKNTTLGEAIKKLDQKGVIIHGAMKDAFNSLYGYTSDKSGIRHGKAIDEKTTFEEAKYMLVSCSAFLNYLIEVYENTKN